MKASVEPQPGNAILAGLGAVLSGFVIAGAAVPLYLLAKQSISPELETFAWPPSWLPHRATLAHFAAIFAVTELRDGVIRSLLVAVATGIAATAFGAMLAYSMTRGGLGRRAGFATLSGVRLLPMITVAIPLGMILSALGLSDSPSAMGLAAVHTAIAIPTAALTLYAAFMAIPVEVEEAAWMDGASPLRIFLSIDLPMVRGSLATAFILCFILSWDEFGFALLLQQTNRTLPPLLYYYTVFGNVGPASALALLMLLPAIALIVALGSTLRDTLMSSGYR
ncbi:MAG: carbohydrate ABC transporter permease [Candidatus Binatus sp.]|uniref:carbohydrate ABC transporter permease n=1 Tax=Candidatus Binatus sp. TaxID=2811406 RepID=UPI002719CBAB|nr:carbohydrate ABC transporter permease [Candidatus Binatus sp.]MDO8434028.1 carbohydrate ABC transporter permease [Candidatus Binatus sp.]